MSDDLFDAYAVLQVSRDADAGAIRAMYRELSKRHHPDTRGGTGGEQQFARVKRARDLLLDPAQRASLDEALAARDRDAARAHRSDGPGAEPHARRGSAPGHLDPGGWDDEWGEEAAWTPAPGQPPRPTGPDPWQLRQARLHPTIRSPPYDGVAIAALVTSILCSPIGLVLGLAGLYRTRRRIRRGRWAALWATVVGAILTIPSVLGLLALSPETVSPSSASVGDCVDRDGRWTATDLREASCSQEHDAEVVYQGRFDAKLVRALRNTRPAQLCRRLLPRKVGRAVVDGSARLRLVVESRSPARPKRDDAFVCLAVGSGDGQLYGPLLGSRGASGHVAHA